MFAFLSEELLLFTRLKMKHHDSNDDFCMKLRYEMKTYAVPLSTTWNERSKIWGFDLKSQKLRLGRHNPIRIIVTKQRRDLSTNFSVWWSPTFYPASLVRGGWIGRWVGGRMGGWRGWRGASISTRNACFSKHYQLDITLVIRCY